MTLCSKSRISRWSIAVSAAKGICITIRCGFFRFRDLHTTKANYLSSYTQYTIGGIETGQWQWKLPFWKGRGKKKDAEVNSLQQFCLQDKPLKGTLLGHKEFRKAKNTRIGTGLESKCIIKKKKKAEFLFLTSEKAEFRPKCTEAKGYIIMLKATIHKKCISYEYPWGKTIQYQLSLSGNSRKCKEKY